MFYSLNCTESQHKITLFIYSSMHMLGDIYIYIAKMSSTLGAMCKERVLSA